MKVLAFHIGGERYALPLAALLRVLPAARLAPLPGAPACVAGLLDLHGEPVPVIDLARLAGGAPETACFDTRILLLEAVLAGRARRLGLLAGQVDGVATIDDAPSHRTAGVVAAPWLGAVASGGAGMLQLVDPAHLLAPALAARLFGEVAA